MNVQTPPEPFCFRLATREIILGAGRLSVLPELASRHGARRIVAVIDAFVARTPWQQRIQDLLHAPGWTLCMHAIPDHEPDTDSVAECFDVMRRADPDFVVAVGGDRPWTPQSWRG